MERWLYAYRQVAGDVTVLDERLREGLRDMLSEPDDAPEVDGSFRTRLRSEIAGIDTEKLVRVRVGVAGRRGSRLRIPLAWEAESGRRVFPRFDGTIELEPMSAARAQLTLTGSYEVPFGPLGALADASALRRVAEASAEELVERIATGLGRDPSRPPTADRYPRLTVADVMTPDPVVLDEELPLRTAALLLFHHRIGGAPVLADDGSLVGVLSEADLLDKEAAPARSGREATVHELRAAARTVGEACSRPARVTVPDAALRKAAREMLDARVARLVVVDGTRVVGIVSRHDVLRALVRTDASIADAVRAVLVRLDEHDIAVEVDWGVVTLSGSVTSRSRISVVERAVREVDGVMDLQSSVGWLIDDTLPASPPLA